MLSYKPGKHDGIHVIITLEIPDDAITNMKRSSIIVKETALYRTNKALVKRIEDSEGNRYSAADAFMCSDSLLSYMEGQMVEEPKYDMNKENICSVGIHFFLSRRCAELYNIGRVQNGLYEEWYNSGQKAFEVPCVNGRRHGLSKRWYEGVNQICIEVMYENGKQKGLFLRYYPDGKKHMEYEQMNGIPVERMKIWSRDGMMKESICGN